MCLNEGPSGGVFILSGAITCEEFRCNRNTRRSRRSSSEASRYRGNSIEHRFAQNSPWAKLTVNIGTSERRRPHFLQRLTVLTSRQQQTQRTLLDWLRMEYAIEKPSNKLLAATDLDSDTWVGEVKRIRGKKQPLTAAGVHGLRDEYTRTLEPARALAAETLTLEHTLSDLVNQAYTPCRIACASWRVACSMNRPPKASGRSASNRVPHATIFVAP